MVSVIIPTYNRAYCLKRSIESVLAQTYNDLELIIVDDGSTDHTKEIVSQMADPKIRYVYQEHSGACFARNRGINEANGEYIAFQDSDDYWHPMKLEMQMECMCQEQADIVFCAFERIDCDNQYLNRIPDNLNQSSGFIDIFTILPGNICSTQTILLKKECFTKNRFNEELRRLQEWELMIRLIQQYKVYFYNKVLVTQYLQKNSISFDTEAYSAAMSVIVERITGLLKDETVKSQRLLSQVKKKDEQILELEKRCRQLESEADSFQNPVSWKRTVPGQSVIDRIRTFLKK